MVARRYHELHIVKFIVFTANFKNFQDSIHIICKGRQSYSVHCAALECIQRGCREQHNSDWWSRRSPGVDGRGVSGAADPSTGTAAILMRHRNPPGGRHLNNSILIYIFLSTYLSIIFIIYWYLSVCHSVYISVYPFIYPKCTVNIRNKNVHRETHQSRF